MTIAADIADDYLHWANAQSVTVSHQKSTGTPTTSTVGYAIKAGLAQSRGTFSGIQLTGQERLWVIPNTLLTSGEVISEGDTITHGSDVWEVKVVNQYKFDTEWHCLCLKQR